MKWSYVATGTGFVAVIVAALISDAAERHFKDVAVEKAAEEVTTEVRNQIANAKETLDLAEAVGKRERKEIYDGVKAWKRDNDYDFRIQSAHNSAMTELDEFKTSIDYYGRKEAIDEAYENGIDIFKDTVDYDYEISLQESIIEDAKTAYKKRCKKIDNASDADEEISDALKNLKKNEKEKTDEIIEEAKGKIADLKQRLAAEENRLLRKKQADLRALDSELQPTRARLNKSETEACNLINAEKAKAEEKIRSEVKAKRTKEESLAIEKSDDCIKLIDNQRDIDDKNAWTICENTPMSEKWASYLKEKDCPRWVVVFVAALPLIPVGFCLKKYVQFVYSVVKAM